MCRISVRLTENNAKRRRGSCKETGKPKSFVQGQSFYRWAARSCSLSRFGFPPTLRQFWEGRWYVLSPTPQEVSELLGHERKSVQNILPCAS